MNSLEKYVRRRIALMTLNWHKGIFPPISPPQGYNSGLQWALVASNGLVAYAGNATENGVFTYTPATDGLYAIIITAYVTSYSANAYVPEITCTGITGVSDIIRIFLNTGTNSTPQPNINGNGDYWGLGIFQAKGGSAITGNLLASGGTPNMIITITYYLYYLGSAP